MVVNLRSYHETDLADSDSYDFLVFNPGDSSIETTIALPVLAEQAALIALDDAPPVAVAAGTDSAPISIGAGQWRRMRVSVAG
jgi:hypothetical protein